MDRLNRLNLTSLLILAVAGLSLFVFACGGGGAGDAPEGGAPDEVTIPGRWVGCRLLNSHLSGTGAVPTVSKR